METDKLFGKVLLVEDDGAHALLITRALKNYTPQIVTATSIRKALSQLDGFQPDLIVTDLNLPDSVGLTHIEQLKIAAPGVPVVVLTSSTSLKEAVEAMRLGARDFLVKNFDVDFAEVLGLALSRLYTTLEMERERSRLQREMEALRISIENGHDGLAVLGPGGDVTYSNASYRTFVKLCGGSSEHLLEIAGEAVVKADTLIDNLRTGLGSLQPGGVWHTQVAFKENKELAFALSLSAIRESATGSSECVVWVRDISDQKRREKFQREILSTTTHDLKGPLSAILISTDLLLEMLPKQDRTSELVIRISSCAQNAVNLIDEFLSARRIQEGTFILKPALQNVSGIVREVAADYFNIAAAKNIQLTCESTDEEAEISLDRMGLVRVLGNLLSNACKFTKKGGKIWVRVRPAQDEVHIEVEDTGTGMEPSDVQKIFERFSRLERHGDVAGSGIGLFVVKSIVTAHGGRIEVTSKVGQGTKFDITFPSNPPVNERGELISLDFA